MNRRGSSTHEPLTTLFLKPLFDGGALGDVLNFHDLPDDQAPLMWIIGVPHHHDNLNNSIFSFWQG